MDIKTTKKNIDIIVKCLEYLDLVELSNKIKIEMKENPTDDALAIVALNMSAFSEEKHNRIVKRLLDNSGLRAKHNFDQILQLPERQLDMEMINELSELHFIHNHENLILWGPPGTGKTWLAETIITSACFHHIKSRWISFPALYRELEAKYAQQQSNKKDAALDKRMRFYAKFPLLCIDEL